MRAANCRIRCNSSLSKRPGLRPRGCQYELSSTRRWPRRAASRSNSLTDDPASTFILKTIRADAFGQTKLTALAPWKPPKPSRESSGTRSREPPPKEAKNPSRSAPVHPWSQFTSATSSPGGVIAAFPAFPRGLWRRSRSWGPPADRDVDAVGAMHQRTNSHRSAARRGKLGN